MKPRPWYLRKANGVQSLIARLVTGIILPLAVSGLFGILLYGQSTLHDVALRDAMAITALKSNIMSSWLRDRQMETEGIATSKDVINLTVKLQSAAKEGQEQGITMDLLKSEIEGHIGSSHPSIRSITLLDIPTKLTLLHLPESTNNDIQDPSNLVALASATTTFLTRYDTQEEYHEIYIAAPIIASGTPRAIIFIEFETDSIGSTLTDRTGLGARGATYMLDKTGTFITPVKGGGTDTPTDPNSDFNLEILSHHAQFVNGTFSTQTERKTVTMVAYITDRKSVV